MVAVLFPIDAVILVAPIMFVPWWWLMLRWLVLGVVVVLEWWWWSLLGSVAAVVVMPCLCSFIPWRMCIPLLPDCSKSVSLCVAVWVSRFGSHVLRT